MLSVDDDALQCRSLDLILEQSGHRTSTAASAEDALALTRRDQPDLILLGIEMPGLDGLEDLRRFQEQVSLPTIFLTVRWLREELEAQEA
jgi:DNA-binding response OmpR family regulator